VVDLRGHRLVVNRKVVDLRGRKLAVKAVNEEKIDLRGRKLAVKIDMRRRQLVPIVRPVLNERAGDRMYSELPVERPFPDTP